MGPSDTQIGLYGFDFDGDGEPDSSVPLRGLTDDIAYAARFDTNAEGLQGEWTPRYMFDPWGMPRLAAVAPHARILVILRDPWARAVSGYLRSKNQRLANDVWMMHDAISKSLYARQVERIYEWFDADSIVLDDLPTPSAFPEVEVSAKREFSRDAAHLSALVPDLDLSLWPSVAWGG